MKLRVILVINFNTLSAEYENSHRIVRILSWLAQFYRNFDHFDEMLTTSSIFEKVEDRVLHLKRFQQRTVERSSFIFLFFIRSSHKDVK